MTMSFEPPCGSVRWPMLRLKGDSRCTVRLLSGDWVRLATHFHRSTFLCPESEECHACVLLPSRALWYLPAEVVTSHAKVLVEFGARASADLEQQVRFSGSKMRAGIVTEMRRASAKGHTSSRVQEIGDECSPVLIEEWVTALMAVYKMPGLIPGETLGAYGKRVANRVIERANLIAGWMTKAEAGRARSRVAES